MATTKRSRKTRRIKISRRVKITAIAVVITAIAARCYPAETASFTLGGLAVAGWFRRSRQQSKPAPRQPARKSPADPGQKARDRGWVPPLSKNLVPVSRQCATGQHILCATTECECDDCFSHDEEKIMKRNRDEYDSKFPDEPPF